MCKSDLADCVHIGHGEALMGSIGANQALCLLAEAFSIDGPASTSLGSLLAIRRVRETLAAHNIGRASLGCDRLDNALGHLANGADALRHLTGTRIQRMNAEVARICDARCLLDPPPGLSSADDDVTIFEAAGVPVPEDASELTDEGESNDDAQMAPAAASATRLFEPNGDGSMNDGSVRSAGSSGKSRCFGGSWHASDEGDGALSHGGGDDCAAAEASSAGDRGALEEERCEWLARYWDMAPAYVFPRRVAAPSRDRVSAALWASIAGLLPPRYGRTARQPG